MKHREAGLSGFGLALGNAETANEDLAGAISNAIATQKS
jgi:hypothetical protein